MKLGDIRRHLMTGVSFMIPFVVPGGILIAIAFMAGGIHWENAASQWLGNLGKIAFGLMVPAMAGYIGYSVADRPGIAPGFIAGMIANDQGSGFIGGILGGLMAGYIVSAIKQIKVPSFLRPMMPVLIIPLFGSLIVGALMSFVVGPPASWLNAAMTSALTSLNAVSKVLLSLALGAMMAFDMGGPVNKAAYMFALGLTEADNWVPVAAVMVGGMTPPLGVAFAMLLAKNKFTALEREGLAGCFVGAASFITEFAIPYAAADPIRVIPSLMVGSGVGAALSMLTGVSLRAPHGGLFVIPLANKPLMWLISIIVGGLATAGMLILLKPALPPEKSGVLVEASANPGEGGDE
jgi:PTS system fructose-specific IIC component